MDVFQLATRLVTTGEEQTAESLKRVEGVGTKAANNIQAAWAGINLAPASRSAANINTLQKSMTGAQGALANLAASAPTGGQALEKVGGSASKLEPLVGKLQRALFGLAGASVGVPGPLGRVAESFLMLGTGGLVVAGVTAGMALIGAAMADAREKAEKETTRIQAAVDKWEQRLDEMTGRARRLEIDALAGDVEKLSKALEAAQLNQRLSTQGAPSTSPLVAQRAAEVKAAEDALEEARRSLRLAQGTHETGPGSDAEHEAAKRKIDEERSAYERYLQALEHGSTVDRTRQASLAALQVEEAKLETQLHATNLPLEERIRLSGMLLQVQTSLGDLPETDEQRAAAIQKVRDSYQSYLDLLQRAVAFEATRPAALDEISAAIARTEVRLRSQNLDLAEEVRLRTQLRDLKAAQGEGVAAGKATQKAALADRNNSLLAGLQAGLDTDLEKINNNTLAMIQAMGPALTEAAVASFAAVQEVFKNAPLELAQTLGAGLATAFTGDFGKAGDIVLQGLGNIFTAMGKALITHGVIMSRLLPHLLNPFTSGPAAIAAGVALLALGTALGGIASGHGGGYGGGGGSGASFDGYHGTDDKVVRIIVNQPAGTSTAQNLTPVAPTNFTIIGPADPLAQRAIAQIVNTAKARGLTS